MSVPPGPRRPAAVLVGTVLLAGLGAGGCLPARDRTDRPALDVDQGGGQLLGLQAEPPRPPSIRPDELCRPGGPAVGGRTLVDCQLFPLLSDVAARCNATADVTAVPDDARRCRPGDPSLSDDVVGWVVTSGGVGERTLAIYRSETTAVPVGPGDSPVAGTAGSTMLQLAYRAADAGNRWSELAVCARDVDRNGSNDVLVLTRSTDATRVDTPEVVVVSFVTAPAEVGGKAMPSLQSARPVHELARQQGQGCRSPMVEGLSADGGTLRLTGERRPA